MDLAKHLESIYFDAANHASFSSAERLYSEAKKERPNIKLDEVKAWLAGQFTYTLHKQPRHKFPRNRVVSSKPGEHMQADLVDLRMFASHNRGFKYLLTAIDVFSKFAFAVPLKNKSGEELLLAFSDLFEFIRPENLQTDEGTEFMNRPVQQLFKDSFINHFVAKNKTVKCSVIERFNRTLKGRMFKYFTATGTRKYIDVLPKILQAYNESYHSSIKMRPIDVSETNQNIVYKNLFGCSGRRDMRVAKVEKPALEVGDSVRLKYARGAFDRGYHPYWKDEIMTICKIIKGQLPRYKVMNDFGVVEQQLYYKHELQKVSKGRFRIEKVIKRDIKNKRVFVKWLNYSEAHNSWIDQKAVESLT